MPSWIQRIFGRNKQLVLAPGIVEMTILEKTRTVMLFVYGNVEDQGPYEDLAKHFNSKGYYMQAFYFPPEQAPK